MRILITGSSGLLGARLVRRLEERGDEVWRLDRRPGGARSLVWPATAGELEQRLPAGLEAVVHLAGSPIAVWPWNRAARARILQSRTVPTRRLAEALAQRAVRPARLLESGFRFHHPDLGEALQDLLAR